MRASSAAARPVLSTFSGLGGGGAAERRGEWIGAKGMGWHRSARPGERAGEKVEFPMVMTTAGAEPEVRR
jgi:hypothetical protein